MPEAEPIPPNPGSEAAIAQGCLCPVLDNGYGRGYLCNPERFWITAGCPLHCPPFDLEEEE